MTSISIVNDEHKQTSWAEKFVYSTLFTRPSNEKVAQTKTLYPPTCVFPPLNRPCRVSAQILHPYSPCLRMEEMIEKEIPAAL